MSEEIATKIAELEATLHMLGLPTAAREAVEQQLSALRGQIVQQQSGGANLGVSNTIGQTGDIIAGDQTHGRVDNQGHINGIAIGVNLGRIVYGRDPLEDERRRLVWYLDRLVSKLYRFSLRGLEDRLDQGDGLALPKIYVMLALQTTPSNSIEVVTGTLAKLADFFDRKFNPKQWYTPSELTPALKREYHPDWALPNHAITHPSHMTFSLNEPIPYQLARDKLAIEIVGEYPRLALLGDPGGGKSTFLRHLAWALARHGLDQQDDMLLHGWDDQPTVLPIMVPLRVLAGWLARDGVSNSTVYAALRNEILACNVPQVDDMLNAALHGGAALLLCDGLDEVPLDPVPDITVNRTTVLQAIRAFAQLHAQTRIVVTCRTRAFDDNLRIVLGWHTETIAPFTLGQIRHFVPAWYAELVVKGQLMQDQATRLEHQLLDTLIASPKLRVMAENPLLLTMMALVLYNKGELPRDRALLYERILELLLGQWDKVREGMNLAEAIGQPDWSSERIRPLLDRLSYDAHAGVVSADGRGRLARGVVREALISFFETARLPQPWETARRCLDYFDQRSSLLIPDDAQDSYVFAHLTLQEHCAGRALVLDPDAVALIMRHRANDRWREPIFLGLGVAQQINPTLLDRVLTDLIDAGEDGRLKPVDRRQRDLILAAEIGADRDWDYLRTQRVNVDRLQRDLRRGLVELLQDVAQPLLVAERVRASFLLGNLGDPRVPITLEDWCHAVTQTQAGDLGGYFCRVVNRTYTIGYTDDDPDATGEEKPQHTVTFDAPFWIARFPITNAQWQAWVQAGGTQPHWADDADLNHPNQPVVGVSWHMCNEFCAWLSAQLGLTVRLPTEQEWEAAARGGDMRCYPWGDTWQDDHATTQENQEIRGATYTTPIGCYPAGAAPCGALDMVGNVWEWIASTWQSYPGAEKSFAEERWNVLRGGSCEDIPDCVSCGARRRLHVGIYPHYTGFRVVCVPRSVQIC